MNIAIFGGSFDPIHRGHLAIAHAALSRFKLATILFVPTPRPAHKPAGKLAAFVDRYAMVVLATATEKRFIPSAIEFEKNGLDKPSYSIDTVHAVRRTMKKTDSLFFLAGLDSFLDISTWRRPEDLLRECQFIVATRPGYPKQRLSQAMPKILQGNTGSKIHLLDSVHDHTSSTAIRLAAAQGKTLAGMVPQTIVRYINKRRLYAGARPAAKPK